MDALFIQRFNRLEDLLNEYQKETQGLSYEQLNKKPDSGGWSINEVIHHIKGVEAGTILYIQKKLQTPEESKNSGIKSWYRASLLRYALRSKRKFRAPKVLTEPDGPYEVDQLFKDWQASRDQLRKVFENVPAEHKNRELFKHPVVGYINLKQTLGFMADHMQRHLEQIQGLKSEFRFV